jgi:hypothetical protein
MNIKFTLAFGFSFLCYYSSFSQVGLGTTEVEKSAVLELKSTERGFLIPRMTTLEKNNIENPAEGLMVYSTNSCNNGALSIYSNGNWRTVPHCPDIDFDDDGVPNTIDIDDDNDGILDVLEKSKQSESLLLDNTTDILVNWGSSDLNSATGSLSGFKYATSPAGSSGTITYNNVKGVRVLALDNIFRIQTYNTSNVNSPSNADPGNYGDLNISVPAPNESSNSSVEISSNPLIIGDIDGDFVFDLQVTTLNGLITDINKFEHAITNGPSKGTSSLVDLGGGTFRVTVNHTSSDGIGPDLRVDILDEYVTNYFIDIVSTTTSGGDNILFPISRDLFASLDADGDGTPNHLDLDSDNDGCSDALEAGSTTNTTANFNYTNTEVGANGLSNSIETSDLQSGVNVSPIDTSNAYDSGVVCP